MNIFKNLVTTLMVLALLGVSTTSCNTFRGAGKDIQESGKSIENAAEGAQRK